MEVQMHYRLTGRGAAVGYDSKAALFNSHLFGNFGDYLKNLGNICAVFPVYFGSRNDMLLGD